MSLLIELVGVKREEKHGDLGRKKTSRYILQRSIDTARELRRKYLDLGVALEDLYCYFEDRRCMVPGKRKDH